MTSLLASLSAQPLPQAALGLCAGLGFAGLWLLLLRQSAGDLAAGRPGRGLALGLGRLAAAGALFAALVQLGAAPVLVALAAFTIASGIVLSRVSGA